MATVLTLALPAPIGDAAARWTTIAATPPEPAPTEADHD